MQPRRDKNGCVIISAYTCRRSRSIVSITCTCPTLTRARGRLPRIVGVQTSRRHANGDPPRKAWLVDRAVVLCQGLVRRFGMHLTGRRSKLGSMHGPMNNEWLNATHTAMLAAHGFNVGYSPLVWQIVFNQALGGLLVAVVIKVNAAFLPTHLLTHTHTLSL